MAALIAMHDTAQIVARHVRRQLSAVVRTAGGLAFALCGGVACSSDTAGLVPSLPVYVLKLQWPALNLALTAPYDTAQLVATLQTSTGAPVTDTSTVQYVTTDSSIKVSSTGLVTARFPTTKALVVARRTIHGVTVTDTAAIQVTQTPFPASLQSLSIQPRPDGLVAARTNINNQFTVVPFFATIATGDPGTDTLCAGVNGCTSPLLVRYTSSDTTIAGIDQYGDVSPNRPGRVVFTISTVAYGVHKIDSLPFSVGYSSVSLQTIGIDSSQHPPVDYLMGVSGPERALHSVGMQLIIDNETDQAFTLTLPEAAGVHFAEAPQYTNNYPGPSTRVGTVPTSVADPFGYVVVVQLDSAGTYSLQYRGLKTGVTFSETLTILPYP